MVEFTTIDGERIRQWVDVDGNARRWPTRAELLAVAVAALRLAREPVEVEALRQVFEWPYTRLVVGFPETAKYPQLLVSVAENQVKVGVGLAGFDVFKTMPASETRGEFREGRWWFEVAQPV